MKTLKVIAALLHYPQAELLAHPEVLSAAVLDEALVDGETLKRLAGFIDGLAAEGLMEAQGRYVETFDRGRSLSLHLFEHVHGESRDRGQAMVDLLEVYKAGGMEVALNELPDYIPLFLEFCSTLERAAALAWLEEVAHIFQLLHARLRERDNPYAVLFEALLTLACVELAPAEVKAQVRQEGRDDTPEALDKVWAEEPAFFGMPGACGGSQAKPQVQAVRWGDPRKAGSANS